MVGTRFFDEGDEEVGWLTTHDTGWPRAWLSASTPGMRTGSVDGSYCSDGVLESSDEGKARDDRYVAAVR